MILLILDAVQETCKTGGPLATCCPIACPMWPVAILYSNTLLDNIFYKGVDACLYRKKMLKISHLRPADSFTI